MEIKQTFHIGKSLDDSCFDYYVNESKVGICPRCGSMDIIADGYWREALGFFPVLEVRPMECNNCGLYYTSKALPDGITIK